MASALVIEIGMTILALGVLVFFLTGFVGGGAVFEIALALVIGGIGLMVLGLAIGRRREDRH